MILIICLPMVVFTMISSKFEVFKIRSFVVQTGSMEPAINAGSVSFAIKQTTYELGDVVTFENRSKLNVTHRISQTMVQDGEVFYQTQGDSNKDPDSELIFQKSIIGKNVLTIPLVGKIFSALKTSQGFLGMIVMPGLIFIVLEILNIKKELESEIEKKIKMQLGII